MKRRSSGSRRLRQWCLTISHNRLSNYQSAKNAYSNRTSSLGTYAKKGPLDGVTRSREHKEKTRLNPTVQIETTSRHTQTKPSNTLQQPERDQAKQSNWLLTVACKRLWASP